MSTNVKQLETRAKNLEKTLSEVAARCRGLNCNCRDETRVHNPDELEAIMKIHCPEHGVCDLGYISFLVHWLPLAPEFRQFCHCPPNLHRDFVAGMRAKPTAAELQEESRRDYERNQLMSKEDRKRAFEADRDKFRRLVDEHRRAVEEQRERMQNAKLSESMQKMRNPER